MKENQKVFSITTQTIICEAQAKSVECFFEEEKQEGCSSEKARKGNALALIADEGRDNLRKAAVRWK